VAKQVLATAADAAFSCASTANCEPGEDGAETGDYLAKPPRWTCPQGVSQSLTERWLRIKIWTSKIPDSGAAGDAAKGVP
jgi:hypothetical protein